jgi:hypothetical protein
MAVALRVPSVEALFDAWSPEPLERRPLGDEARQRILDAWSEASSRKRQPDGLTLSLPAAERQEGLEDSILAAIRHDMEEMRVDAKRHWVRRAVRVRESRIGFAVFALAIAISGLIDYGAEEGSLNTLVSQIFVVIAWVALWAPAFRLMTAASYRLGRHSFEQIAAAKIEIRWV